MKSIQNQLFTSFYPGPSKVYPQVANYLQDAYSSGILMANHRSKAGMDLVKQTIDLFREKLNLPTNYSLYFTSSATECWEIVTQSLINGESAHYFNGAFGEKWYDYTKKISKFPVIQHAFNLETEIFQIENNDSTINNSQNEIFQIENNDSTINYSQTEIFQIENNASTLCITQNETSNGTQVSMEQLARIRNATDAIVAVDATSSMAGIDLDWQLADVWLASVQKCFGLPAGLGLLVCSSKALKKAQEINANNHYNSLIFLEKNAQMFQTAYTPNMLGIYLLNRVLQQIPNISQTALRIEKQAKEWYTFIENETDLSMLIENNNTRSQTVIVVKGQENKIEETKKEALLHNIILGNGYGNLQSTTFRIANFPAIDSQEIEKLKMILKIN